MSLTEKAMAKLNVEILPDKNALGRSAAEYVADCIKKASKEKGNVRMVFAAAISQREFLAELVKMKDIPWPQITAFHMDEYHTLPESAPQRFGNFLWEHLFRLRDFGAVHYIKDDLEQYAALINEAPIDIACLGIGENGHLAFNDPSVADFEDPHTLKKVKLDRICRQQQVNDGEFADISEVPESAVTLTIPALMKADFLSVVVPGAAKAAAVAKTLYHPVSTECPSTILRTHPRVRLFLDDRSAKKIMERT